jgi:2-acylglycerol O-acyltransferase 2
MGMTLFWGIWGTPLPFTPRVSMCIGDPIQPPVWDKEKHPNAIPPDVIDAYHELFLKAMTDLFDKYKAAAGYPDAVLTIQ